MSHTIKASVQLTAIDSLNLAAAELRLELQTTARCQSLDAAARKAGPGIEVRLPGWQKPVFVAAADGAVYYDNYEGRWGKQVELDKLFQTYTKHAAIAAAKRQGHTVSSCRVNDKGEVVLNIQVAAPRPKEQLKEQVW